MKKNVFDVPASMQAQPKSMLPWPGESAEQFAARASQLALPAGPVPEGLLAVAAEHAAQAMQKKCFDAGSEAAICAIHFPPIIKAAVAAALASPSPAVAQPVADERCPHCDGTGDVHDQTGEWRGTCQPCADADLLEALTATATGCPSFESGLPMPNQGGSHFSTAHLTQQQDELFSLLSPGNVLRLVKLAGIALRVLKNTLGAPLPHSDEIAVDRFAAAMKEKLGHARDKGRGGWEQCDPVELSLMLREHVEKGDPRDVANFCMFLWSLGKPISTMPSPAVAHPQAQVEVTAWSSNDEEFNAKSLEELLDIDDGLTIGSKVYFGNAEYPSTSQLCDADDVIELMGDRANDLAGEYAEGYPDVTDEARAELDALLAAWISKHCQPTFFTVTNVQSRILTKQDFPECHPALEQEGGEQ